MSIERNNKEVDPIERGICPIPAGTRFVVTIDGKPYAGFVDRSYAEEAVRMWLGEIDGAGMPVPYDARARHAWRAVRGRKVEILER